MVNKKRRNKIIFATILWGIIVFPMAFFTILIVRVEQEKYGSMPAFEELENPKSNIASEVYSEDHKLLGTFHIENRSFVAFEEMSPNLIKAVIATEDARFTDHSGVDLIGLMRVAIRTLALGDRSQGGGSTITQQLAKHLFPRSNVSDKNIFKKYWDILIIKLKEWVTAVKLERSYTKNEIIAMYLNVIPYGSNAFGIRAASLTFFNKQPSQLNVEEAALLAGIINAPTRYSPVRNYYNALSRRNFVMRQMVRAEYLTLDEYDRYSITPIELRYQQEDHNTGIGTYFRERVRQIMIARMPDRKRYATTHEYQIDSLEWEQNPLYGWCHKNRKPNGDPYDVNRDGLKIYTTLNSKMQTYAEQALVEHLKMDLQPALSEEIREKGKIWGTSTTPEQEEDILIHAIKQTERYRLLRNEGVPMNKIMEIFKTPVDMTLFTWEGEADVTISPLDSILYYKSFLRASFMAMDPHTGYIKAYVGGPNFKYFKYDLVKQSKRQVGSTIKPFLYTLAMQEGYSPCHKVPNVPQTFVEGDSTWTPRNSGATSKDGKMVTLKWGLSNSVNNISAWLIKQFNPQSVVDLCYKMGISSKIAPVNSIFLGTAEMSLYELTNAFATFVNKGVRVTPVMVTRIEDKNGNVLSNFPSTHKEEAISEQTAYLMTNLLQSVVNSGTGYRLRGKYWIKGAIGGKTGTTQNQSDGWFMGITPKLATGCWVGCEDRTVHFESLRLGQGANTALPIFANFWQKVLADNTLPYSIEDVFEAPLNMRKVNLDCSNIEEATVTPADNLDTVSPVRRRKASTDDFF